MELMQANAQWSSRPSDERFESLDEMLTHFRRLKANSRGAVASSRAILCEPGEDHKGLTVKGGAGVGYAPTHWAFGQLATLAKAPAGYLRSRPSDIAADCINYGLKFSRDIEDVGLLLQRDFVPAGDMPPAGGFAGGMLRAATGPRYGRIWNETVVSELVSRFGDGVSGEWTVPGEFGHAVQVSKANTTLFAGDRDCWIFLANEKNRIEVPGRRNGEPGSLARGFFVWNSEVGAATFGIATFLFDYVCCNRIIWGAQQYNEVRIRHTASAPDKWFAEMQPALERYGEGSTQNIQKAIRDARQDRLNDVDEWLGKRFGAGRARAMQQTHLLDEERPIETRWDAIVGATAYAQSIKWQDERVELEREAGKLLEGEKVEFVMEDF